MGAIAIIENSLLAGRYFKPFVEAAGLECSIFKVWRGEPLAVEGFSALILTGDFHNVTDGLKAYHESELELLERGGGRRVFASCFSHQMIAQSRGGTVERRSERLLGWERLNIVGKHPAVEGMGAFPALCLNTDEVTAPPPGAAWIAESPGCRYQVLAYGDEMLTCQAHPELSLERARIPVNAAALFLSMGRPGSYRSFKATRALANDAGSDEFMRRVVAWLAD